MSALRPSSASTFSAFEQDVSYELVPGPTPAAPIALLVHALTGDRALLAECFDEPLARRGFARLYVDLPGHGASSLGAKLDAASADHLAAVLAGLATRIQDDATRAIHAEALASDAAALPGPAPPLYVFAYSYGAYLAQSLLLDVPVAGLFLVCPVVEPEVERRRRPARHILRVDEDLAYEDDHERETFAAVAVQATQDVLAAYRRLVLPASRAVNRAFVDGVRARYLLSRPTTAALSQFAGPVTILCGRHDHWVGFEDAARLAALLCDSALLVERSAGQLLPLEAPAVLESALEAFLDRALHLAPVSIPEAPQAAGHHADRAPR